MRIFSKKKKPLDLEPLRRQWIADAVKTAKDPSHAFGVSSAEAKDKATAICAALTGCPRDLIGNVSCPKAKLPKPATPFPFKERPPTPNVYHFVRFEVDPAPAMRLRGRWEDLRLLRCSAGNWDEFEAKWRNYPFQPDFLHWRETDRPADKDKFVWFKVTAREDAEPEKEINVFKLLSQYPANDSLWVWPYAEHLWGMKAGETKRVGKAWPDCGIELPEGATLEDFWESWDAPSAGPEELYPRLKVEGGRIKTLRHFKIEVLKVLESPDGDGAWRPYPKTEQDDLEKMPERPLNDTAHKLHAMNAALANEVVSEQTDLIVPPGFPAWPGIWECSLLNCGDNLHLPGAEVLAEADEGKFCDLFRKDLDVRMAHSHLYIMETFYDALVLKLLGPDAKLTKEGIAFAEQWAEGYFEQVAPFPFAHRRLRRCFPKSGKKTGPARPRCAI